MGDSHQKAKTAILFDAENISYRHVEAVVKRSAKHGKPILRAYADFSKLQTKGWEKPALKYGIRTIHQFSYDGKNSSSDFLMMHDAFKLMHSGKIDTFVIVTCDKDFITPIQLLRQSGAYVHGMGLKDKTPELLIESCNQFSILDEPVIPIELSNSLLRWRFKPQSSVGVPRNSPAITRHSALSWDLNRHAHDGI